MNPTHPPPGGRSFLGKLTRHTSKQGREYWRCWLGGPSLIAFPGQEDEAGNATLDLFVCEPHRATAGAPKQGQIAFRKRDTL